MAYRTGRPEQHFPSRRIRLESSEPGKSLTVDPTPNWCVFGQKGEIGDDVARITTIRIEGLPVHAPLEAIVDPVQHEVDLVVATSVLREA
jgi:hypothetical protein